MPMSYKNIAQIKIAKKQKFLHINLTNFKVNKNLCIHNFKAQLQKTISSPCMYASLCRLHGLNSRC